MVGSIDGLVSGMGTSDLIAQLMQLERQPQNRLKSQQKGIERILANYRGINTKIAAIGTAAADLTGVKSWALAKASSSDTSRVSVSATAGAAAGSLSFSVEKLAVAHSAVSSGSVSATTTAVVDGPVLLAKGTGALGIATLDQGTSLAAGAHSLEIKDDGAGNLSIYLDGHTTGAAVTAGGAFTVTNAAGDSITGTMGATVKVGKASAHNLDLAADATLQQLADAVGKSGAGVNAAAVQVSTGVYRLQLSSTTTGAASDLMLDPDAFKANTLGSLSTLAAGSDALLKVGSGTAAYDITRSSNTISDLMSGVTMTLGKAEPGVAVTVDVTADAEGVASRVAKMVEAANAALSDMKKLTAYNPETKQAGTLVGDGMVRRLQSELTTLFTSAVAGSTLSTPSKAGISVDKNGVLTFDKAKFLEAYAKDPAAVEALLGKGTADTAGAVVNPGVAGRLEAFNKRITDSVNGLLPSSIKSREGEVRGFTQRIESWDNRLELRERKLKNQFAAMEAALGKMQQQSQRLAGQLAGLMGASS